MYCTHPCNTQLQHLAAPPLCQQKKTDIMTWIGNYIHDMMLQIHTITSIAVKVARYFKKVVS